MAPSAFVWAERPSSGDCDYGRQAVVQAAPASAQAKGKGLVIWDECHILGSEQNYNTALKAPGYFTLGLSAPSRPDGSGYTIPWLTGPLAYVADRNFETALVRTIRVAQGSRVKRHKDLPGREAHITDAAEHEPRNDRLLTAICQLAATGRKMLVLSDRKERVRLLANALGDCEVDVAHIVGETKRAERATVRHKQVAVVIYSIIDKGYNDPDLNTIVFATPRARITQAVGRILRSWERPEGTHLPLIVDVVDTLAGMARTRAAYYDDYSYDVKPWRATEFKAHA